MNVHFTANILNTLGIWLSFSYFLYGGDITARIRQDTPLVYVIIH